MAIQIAVGNLGGAMASNFYRSEDAPRYTMGHALEIAFIVAGMVAVGILVFGYKKINAKREKIGDEGLTVEQMARMGDKSPRFRYVLWAVHEIMKPMGWL